MSRLRFVDYMLDLIGIVSLVVFGLPFWSATALVILYNGLCWLVFYRVVSRRPARHPFDWRVFVGPFVYFAWLLRMREAQR